MNSDEPEGPHRSDRTGTNRTLVTIGLKVAMLRRKPQLAAVAALVMLRAGTWARPTQVSGPVLARRGHGVLLLTFLVRASVC